MLGEMTFFSSLAIVSASVVLVWSLSLKSVTMLGTLWFRLVWLKFSIDRFFR